MVNWILVNCKYIFVNILRKSKDKDMRGGAVPQIPHLNQKIADYI